jgi:hypothetical protein
MPSIKIASGYTGPGGSTIALANLTNALNAAGVPCTMYGPHEWHLDRCRAARLEDLSLEVDDRLITHFLPLQRRPNVAIVLLTSHENGWFPVSRIPRHWDRAVFLHEAHREFHSDYTGEYLLIPNIREPLTAGDKTGVVAVSGVIGSIEERKQTHVSILRALGDGREKVRVFGQVSDHSYFDRHVAPLLGPRVEWCGYSTDKQAMYDSIGSVYHSSLGEVACLVKDECHATNTAFFGNEQTTHEVITMSNDTIVARWIDALGMGSSVASRAAPPR